MIQDLSHGMFGTMDRRSAEIVALRIATIRGLAIEVCRYKHIFTIGALNSAEANYAKGLGAEPAFVVYPPHYDGDIDARENLRSLER